MIVTVGGMVGAGKSTLGRGLADRFDMNYISAGEVMRKMAAGKGMSLQEFSVYAEKHPRIDKEIDDEQKKKASGNCVVDGRLAAYFIDNADLRVWLTAPIEDRAKRISLREGIGEKKARNGIIEREKSERKRYKRIYDIDLDGLSVYDLVINTGVFDKKATLNIVADAVKDLKN
ncbi:MAG: AAA family ATPase [Candidatus Altiarchaeota archaeon]|nr:AAA family ATPase [Candidatus Altiarchaeota archaeon]